MFREMRRSNQSISAEECVEILKKSPRGVLAVHGEGGYPYALPINFLYADGKLYFHTAKEGHKLDALRADSRVSFCVTDAGVKRDGEWFFRFQSVIAFGKIAFVEEENQKKAILRGLADKYFPPEKDREKAVVSSLDRVEILELTIAHMTGKAVKEK